MLIVSWNVAGLKPALQKINSDYGPNSVGVGNGSGSSSSSGSNSSDDATKKSTHSTNNNNSNNNNNKKIDPFANYLHLHGDIDILCLQEHKIPMSQLSSRSEPHRCSSVEGYESFWSCATGKNSRGFNGVVTYAKCGYVRSADNAPLGDAELDEQGRCVMTDHGKFVLFNVYVPNSRTPESLRNKMKFLNALQRAMAHQRTDKGKHVILVGDMNLKVDKRDTYWKYRCLNVDEMLGRMKMTMQEKEKDGRTELDDDELPKWKRDVANHWDGITRVLQTIEAVPRTTTNPSTKKTFNRFCARVKLLGEDKKGFAMLGGYEDTEEDALGCYGIAEERSYRDPANEDGDAPPTVYRKKNVVCVETLTELMYKIANVSWDEKTQRQIADSDEAGLNLDSPAYSWMKARLKEDGMVDVFREFYPTAEARFTCWHQFTNKRYTNEGGRIDFTLVDRALMDHVEPNDGKTLRCGGKEPHDNPLGEEAALSAATARGMFESGSFAGGGIATATKRALDTQFGESHSGMIYTPPSYSDHIAVSLLMKGSFGDDFVGGELALGNDASTRKAQPHKKQRSIASFFGASSGGSKSSSASVAASSDSASADKKRTIGTNNSSSSSIKKQRRVPKNSVLKHFGKK